ncbi:predicted protein [Histoplasma mississippiense (nom. inval.)]|uniref:predicted protein n=1 Tax=Ajellomyces capsulatus (strain NAm1 / WU24) TaxID=2059318 RepID=UPI000157BECC|nr:predicted protein [Histoplasma mississippiense (nom. inval.)]EDN06957.1 predicted protein [Histoplasma mississippiense (nom. inval.)]
MSSEEPIKWTNIKRKDNRTRAPNEGVYARPQARAVRRRKKERRFEHLLRRYKQRCHFPDGHFEVHLWEFK